MRKRGAKNLEPDMSSATRASKRLKEKKDGRHGTLASVATNAAAGRKKRSSSVLKPSDPARLKSKFAAFFVKLMHVILISVVCSTQSS